IVTASFDQTARLWDSASGRERVVLRGHNGEVWRVCFSQDGNRIVTASHDGSARVWEVPSGYPIQTLIVGKGCASAAFSSDGTRILTVGAKAVFIWDARTGREILKLLTDG